MNFLLIYSQQTSSRLRYILEVFYSKVLQLDWQLTIDQQAFISYSGPKLNYSPTRFSGREIHIFPQGLLFEKGVRPHQPPVEAKGAFPVLYPKYCEDADFQYDPLSMCFYLLSRYEEYLSFEADQHGRFPAQASLAYRHGFLHLPVINLWLEEFKDCMRRYFPAFPIPETPFHFQPTYDIDLAWAYLHRGALLNVLGALKDMVKLNWSQVLLRYRVLTRGNGDPFDTYAFIQDLHQEFQLPAHFFFLLGNYGKYDKNIHTEHPALQRLIQQLVAHYPIGIHPSYRSNGNKAQLANEIQRLQNITGHEVTDSRQHYLKLHLPTTYQALINLGITDDYSMGYASEIGFRAGIAHPFPWYDLSGETNTELIIHPFQVMDVTLHNYKNWNAETALEEILPMLNTVRRTGGTFATLWHNSSYAEATGWQGWREMYRKLMAMGAAAKAG